MCVFTVTSVRIVIDGNKETTYLQVHDKSRTPHKVTIYACVRNYAVPALE